MKKTLRLGSHAFVSSELCIIFAMIKCLKILCVKALHYVLKYLEIDSFLRLNRWVSGAQKFHQNRVFTKNISIHYLYVYMSFYNDFN